MQTGKNGIRKDDPDVRRTSKILSAYYKMRFSIKLIMLRTNAPKNALEKLLISNPGTSFAVKASMAPLRTKVNNPNVKSCKGKVKNEKIGLTRVLTRPQTSAAQIAVE